MAGPTQSRQSVDGLEQHVEQVIARQPPRMVTPAPGGYEAITRFWKTDQGARPEPFVRPPPTTPTSPNGRRPPVINISPQPAQDTAQPVPLPTSAPKPWRRWLILSLAIVFILAAIYTAALAWFPPPWWAGQITAHVTKVVDGDTIAVRTPGFPPQTIRLAQIDAPERRQPGGAASTAALKALVMDRDIQVYVTGKDRYGRLIAQLRLGGNDVARQMAREGQAWAYWSYLSDPVVPLLEWRAWLLGTGIWQDSRFGQQPPWVYRAERKHRAAILSAQRKARHPKR